MEALAELVAIAVATELAEDREELIVLFTLCPVSTVELTELQGD